MMSEMTKAEENFWKWKLMAFLHDPPCKCFDIRKHEERAASFRKAAGIDEDDYSKMWKGLAGEKGERQADWVASAADRFPFPERACASKFNGGEETPFMHPLGGSQLSVKVPLETADLAETKFQESIQGVSTDLDWKTKFFLYWRRWPEESARHDGRLAFLPADTRIPDHTIWCHMSLTSALQACAELDTDSINAAFVMFQFGPVQQFIQAARSTRDLLSGSYLLAWLCAHAMKAIADEVGPDAVIFPNLRGQPIFDALYREEMYEKIKYDPDTLWERMGYTDEQLITPTLPNRFLALVPADRAEDLALMAQKALKTAWDEIAQDCWEGFSQLVEKAGQSMEDWWKDRWFAQVGGYWNVTWQVWPWDNNLPMDENLAKIEKLATETIPEESRDKRCYTSPSKNKLKKDGFLWGEQYRQVARLLAMRRNTREFDQFITDDFQQGAPKDVLTGREEIIGNKAVWEALCKDDKSSPFKDNEGPYGAITIIKRLFMRDDCSKYLKNRLGRNKLQIRFDSVEDVAKYNDDDSPYVAVLAMDGDSMGKWISGENAPKLLDQLSDKAAEYFKNLEGFDDSTQRPLSPSYHLQFSEALSNFATRLAGKVVTFFKGQLIYAGGDDVLAMLPADKAVACAQALRACFRGESISMLRDNADLAFVFSGLMQEIAFPAAGWVVPGNDKSDYPLLVPGPESDVSCGIAIAHKHYPLQSMIQQAHDAEKRAKGEYGRSALAISLLKRGGETVHWGCKWEHGALALYHKYVSLRHAEIKKDKAVSSRFPYALAELLRPYELDKHDFVQDLDIKALILKELEQPLERQCHKDNRKVLKDACAAYLDDLAKGYHNAASSKEYHAREGHEPPVPWEDFSKLFLTAAFIERERKED
jgi:CRISPR-associated protein Cmr2